MKAITELIPHRTPFLLVDRLEKVADDEIVGFKTFAADEPFFAGHFPEYPVVPGVLLVECMAQCGGAGIAALADAQSGTDSDSESLLFLASVEKARFRRQVRPGDQARIVVQTKRNTTNSIRQAGQVFVGDELAAEAEWMCLRGS